MSAIVAVTEENIENEIFGSQGIVLLDLWAPWCAPCRTLAPILDKLAVIAGSSIKIAKMDVEQFPDTMSRFSVRGIPALILFKDGEEIGRELGTKTLTQLKAWMAKAGVNLQEAADRPSDMAPFGAFYGDDTLKQFLTDRVLAHSQNGKIIVSRDPSWHEGSGTPSAALVHSADPIVFERLTALHTSFSIALDFAAPVQPDEFSNILDLLRPGSDLSQIPLRLIHSCLSEPAFDWPGVLRHVPEMDVLRINWLTLCEHFLSGNMITETQCASLVKKLEAFKDHSDMSIQSLSELITALSPPPAANDADAWRHIYGLATYLTFPLGQHRCGWTLEDRQTEKRRHEWFLSKLAQTGSDEFTDEQLDACRAQWLAENTEYQAKEEVFFDNEIQGVKGIQISLQQHLASLLASAPSNISA